VPSGSGGPLLFDRILRGQHEERPFERILAPRGRDVILLHRLEQRRLRFRRRAVDLVCKHDVGKHRPGQEAKLAPTRRAVLLDHFGARDVGWH
jgi:hypothetical protein